MTRHRTVPWLALVAATAVVATVAGCSAPSAASAPEAMPSAPNFGGMAPEDASDSGSGGRPAEGGAPAAVDERKIIRVASVDIVVADVRKAASDLRSVALAMGGYVSAESLSIPEDATQADVGYSTVVVSVPATRLDQALTDIAGLGEVRQRSIESTDVTDTVVDTESRIKTMRASIERLQALMAKAGSVSDIASVESELTGREAELEALLGKLSTLNRQVELSPVTVTLRAEAAVAAEPPNGFVAGLQTGWTSFVTFVQVLATALGVMLPYLALLALVAIPLVWWRRRRSRTPMA